jgi:hypothetical protein
VKELRLRGISTREAANADAPSFIADFNRRFAKPPASDYNTHRPLRHDEDLRQILAYRVPRKVTNSLTVQYDRVMYLLEDTAANRRLIHQYVEVVEYPDGVIEVQADGAVLPHTEYDRITKIDQGAEVDNKRLASGSFIHALVAANAKCAPQCPIFPQQFRQLRGRRTSAACRIVSGLCPELSSVLPFAG